MLEGNGKPGEVEARVEQIRGMIEETTSEYEKEKLQVCVCVCVRRSSSLLSSRDLI